MVMDMKRNVMVILCDQLRWDFLSCYGQSDILTENIDSLCTDGVLFTNCTTASPVCAPGRGSMMTGRYVSDHNVWTNDVPFRDGMDFLPERMAKNGYICGTFGKLHHYPQRDNKGFHVALQMEENRLGDQDDYYKFLKEFHPEILDLFPHDENGHFPFPLTHYYEEWIANNTMKFLEENNEKPFFTWVSFQGPHTPIDAPVNNGISTGTSIHSAENIDFDPPCQVPKYRKSRGNSFSATEQQAYRDGYGQLVEIIDHEIGRIISYLKESGKYENTTIIFSADHGDLCGDYNMREKGPFPYRSQLEIPMIIANHPNLPKNVTSDILVSNLDIGTTALELGEDFNAIGYSRSISEMFNNEDKRRTVIYSEFCDSMKLVSTKEYRLAYYPFTGECDLVKIQEETKNLALNPEYQELKAKLLMDIIDFMVVSRGVHIEAQDLTPLVQQGLNEKLPDYQNQIPLVFPVPTQQQLENLKRDNLDPSYNEFCKDKPIIKAYGKYWEE